MITKLRSQSSGSENDFIAWKALNASEGNKRRKLMKDMTINSNFCFYTYFRVEIKLHKSLSYLSPVENVKIIEGIFI